MSLHELFKQCGGGVELHMLYELELSNCGGEVRGDDFRVYGRNINTVEPVYSGHPWDTTRLAVIQRWSAYTGHP